MCVARSEHLNIEWIDYNIDDLGKGVVVGSVGLSVCLSVDNITQKVMNGMKNWLNFGGDLGILRWVNGQKLHHNSCLHTLIVVQVMIQNLWG